MRVARSGSRRSIVVAGAAVAALLAFFAWSAVRAEAAEQLYWNNYSSEPQSIARGDGSGLGSSLLDLGPYQFETPEGMAYDSVTNRLFVAVEHGDAGAIAQIDLATGAASDFNVAGATIDTPEGITVDPVNRTLYWINDNEEPSIGWARLDSSAGGILNTSGATPLTNAYRLAVDPQAGRLYWGNNNQKTKTATISWASVDGSGGGDLATNGATPPKNVNGIAVDSAAGRAYWLNDEDEVLSYASLNGSGGGDVSTGSAAFDEPYGLAIDQSTGKILWANYDDRDEDPIDSFGYVFPNGTSGSLSPSPAPVDGPQDPVLIKSPTASAAPTISRVAGAPTSLVCSTGTWAPDYAGSFVYQAPRTYAYQWSKDGVAIPGAVAATFAATAKGSYACTVTAANQAGAGAATASAATSVTAAKAKLSLKKKLAKAKPGKTATYKVTVVNQGDLATGKSAKLCVKVPKSLKKSLKAGCTKLGGVAGLAKKVAKLKVKVKPTAEPKTYSLKLATSGVSSKPLKVKLKVLG